MAACLYWQIRHYSGASHMCRVRCSEAASWCDIMCMVGNVCAYAELLTCSMVSVDACTEATGWFMTAAAAAWAAALAALAAAAAALDATSPPRGMVGGMTDPALKDKMSAFCLIQKIQAQHKQAGNARCSHWGCQVEELCHAHMYKAIQPDLRAGCFDCCLRKA